MDICEWLSNDKCCVPINMPFRASTGHVLGRCWQHRHSTGPVLAHNGMFTGVAPRMNVLKRYALVYVESTIGKSFISYGYAGPSYRYVFHKLWVR